jgi:hypothetical protein
MLRKKRREYPLRDFNNLEDKRNLKKKESLELKRISDIAII